MGQAGGEGARPINPVNGIEMEERGGNSLYSIFEIVCLF